MNVIRLSLFFFISLPLPLLGLVKLSGHSIHVAWRQKEKSIDDVSCALAQVLELTFSREFSRLDVFFSVVARKERLNSH